MTDLATANQDSNDVSVLLGGGDGTFAPQQTFAIGSDPSSITTGDFNGDGVADLAATNQNSDSVSLLLGNGNGTFAGQQIFATEDLPKGITTGDFDGDGLLDLATANRGSYSDGVSALLNQCDAVSEAVVPDSFTVFRGFQIGGTLADAFESDDSRLRFNPGFTLNSDEAPVWLIFDATLSTDSPNSLKLAVESQAGTPGLTGTLEAFNWVSGDYDVVDVSATSFNIDTVVSVDLSSGVSNYMQTGTSAVRSRIGWRQTGFTLNFLSLIHI